MKPRKIKSERGGVIQIFNSASEASRITGVWLTNISLCCSRRLKTAGGYKWSYIDDNKYKPHPKTDCMPIPAVFSKNYSENFGE